MLACFGYQAFQLSAFEPLVDCPVYHHAGSVPNGSGVACTMRGTFGLVLSHQLGISALLSHACYTIHSIQRPEPVQPLALLASLNADADTPLSRLRYTLEEVQHTEAPSFLNRAREIGKQAQEFAKEHSLVARKYMAKRRQDQPFMWEQILNNQ